MAAQAVLVANGPGELYTWVRPVLRELQRCRPDVRVAISLIPCQFASGHETAIARDFGADVVTSPALSLRAAASGGLPAGLAPAADGDDGFVLSLGGNVAMALTLARRLRQPTYRYSFEPGFDRRLRLLFVPDERTARRARLAGVPGGRLRIVGNLVADAVHLDTPAPAPGTPHVLLFPGSRDAFAVHIIPLLIAVVDRMAPALPNARFVWPVSRLLAAETLSAGIDGRESAVLGGAAGRREGDIVRTPSGAAIEMVPEETRYAHMRAADLALTIPGTNTMELGVTGVPAVVLMPLNRPEVIPLEGIGHWLGLVPVVGRYLKRYAVRLWVEGLSTAVSLPNRFSGEDLMLEMTGRLDPASVAERSLALLANDADLSRRRSRLLELMPGPGAAAALVNAILEDLGAPRGAAAGTP
ncbi:MAG: hypothetical protein P8Z81_06080 [Deinococcales bacterium]